ncbi:15782_t:CDS:1, partial [Dentiscutata erythropus]
MVEINENENEYYTDDYDSEYELYESIRNKPQVRNKIHQTRGQQQRQRTNPGGETIYQSPNFDDNFMVVEPSTTTIPEPVTVTPVRKTKITRQPSVIDQL